MLRYMFQILNEGGLIIHIAILHHLIVYTKHGAYIMYGTIVNT